MFKLFAITCLRLFGWDTQLRFKQEIKKCVIVVAPHTSGWDVVIGVLYRAVIGISAAKFFGKKELFEGPLGFIFKSLGGTPVDRYSKQNLVEQAIELFNQNEKFILALSPEGTRQRVDKLRTGFYYIAKGAKVPIVMAGFDFKNRKLLLSEPFYTSDNEEEDFRRIIAFFAPIQGKIPDLGMGHLMQKE